MIRGSTKKGEDEEVKFLWCSSIEVGRVEMTWKRKEENVWKEDKRQRNYLWWHGGGSRVIYIKDVAFSKGIKEEKPNLTENLL